jgi:hypothetical protein
MLFGIFVAVVAVVTFLVLYMLKPYDSPREKPVAAQAPATPGEKPSAPAPVKTEPAVTKAEKPASEKKPVEEKKKPGPPASQPAPAAVSDTADAKLTVGTPESLEKPGGWQLTIKSTAEVKSKHFTLKDPPRLAIDFLKTTYSGKERLLDSPIPAVSRIRVGEKPEYTRYVIDFSGSKFPKYEVVHEKESVQVNISD